MHRLQRDLSITVDEKNSRIIVIYDAFVGIKGDPEHKKILIRCVRIATKELGVEAEQMRAEELVSDPSGVVMRTMELGMDPGKLAFSQ